MTVWVNDESAAQLGLKSGESRDDEIKTAFKAAQSNVKDDAASSERKRDHLHGFGHNARE